MSKKVTAIFDIGKTNKKFFLFDANFQVAHKEYIQFKEIKDEDGFPTEDLAALQQWIKKVFDRALTSKKFDIKSLNFSTYGASFVHINKKGRVVTPLYNYLKPIPKDVIKDFHEIHGSIAAATGSPKSGMLNAGMQLYWLKKKKPVLFKKIEYSLHFPQYLSYIFTGIPLSEYTSIGCHTGLWDYESNDYHKWVYKEKINDKLPPIVSTQTSINKLYKGKKIEIGIGIHDSSAALLPYLFSEKKPFLLLSTGTWNISLNPFNNKKLSNKDIRNNCLNYMQIDGKRVKATRFFMGNEYKMQVKKLNKHFGKKEDYHQSIKFNKKLILKLKKEPTLHYKFEGISLKRKQPKKTNLTAFPTFEKAYHQLMIELMEVQIKYLKLAIGNTPIKKIYIDGGFIDNDVFINLLADHFSNYKIRTTRSPLGSSLGAAIVISGERLGKSFLVENYRVRNLQES